MARESSKPSIPFPIWFLIGLAGLVAVAWFVVTVGGFFLERRVDFAIHAIMGGVVGACLGAGAIVTWRRPDGNS